MHEPSCLTRPFRPVLVGVACLAVAACAGEVPAVAPALILLPEPVATAAPLPGGDAVLRRLHFRDRHGEGLLVLERRSETPEHADSGEVLDVVVLTAQMHARPGPHTVWSRQWHRQIRQPCAGLDLDAGWLLEHVGVTDLDGDGQAEITLASRTFCGGGGDPHQLHVSLIDGGTRYGVEGDAGVSLPGEEPRGGERHDSANLAAAPAPFVQHLDALWAAVRAQPITM